MGLGEPRGRTRRVGSTNTSLAMLPKSSPLKPDHTDKLDSSPPPRSGDLITRGPEDTWHTHTHSQGRNLTIHGIDPSVDYANSHSLKSPNARAHVVAYRSEHTLTIPLGRPAAAARILPSSPGHISRPRVL